MRNVTMLVPLLLEDRARLMSRLDWLLTALEDRQINDGEKSLLEQAFLVELGRYTDTEDCIAWFSARVPAVAETT